MGMSDQEFYELYGRMPRRNKKKKIKIYWHRIIIALIILIGLIVGLVKLVTFTVGKIKGSNDDNKAAAADNSSTAREDKKTEKDNGEQKQEEHIIYSDVQLIVCVDAGHGDYDAGTTDRDGTRYEKDDDLAIALKVRDYLESCGVTVIMTREDDSFLELGDRCEIANEAKADFMLCLHRNSYDGDIQGVEAWVHNSEPTADTTLAKNLLADLEKAGISANRGVQYGYVGNSHLNYYINNDTVMPSVLLELGFLTDDLDNQLFDENIDAYSVAIGDATIETAIQLGIIDKDGNRLKEGQLISEEKPINNKDNSYSEDNFDIEYTEPGTTPDVYNTQENEVFGEEADGEYDDGYEDGYSEEDYGTDDYY